MREQKIILFFICMYCICLYKCMSCVQVPVEGIGFLELELQVSVSHLAWELETNWYPVE